MDGTGPPANTPPVMGRTILLGFALAALSHALGCAAAQTNLSSEPGPATPGPARAPSTGERDAQAEEVWTLMQGSFSSRAQAESDPEYFDIRLHMLPIWTDREDGRWLYVEQAVAVNPAEPYRQRVYRVTAGEDGAIVSAVYTIEEPLRFAMAWRTPAKLDALTFEDITEKTGCEVILQRQSEGHYAGATREGACRSELRGATHATSEVVVTENGVDSWDRGYDDTDTQVWGAVKSGYQFRPDDPEAAPADAPPPAEG